MTDKYIFEKANSGDIEAIFELVRARVDWMEESGIKQWNCNSYLEAFPAEYYAEEQSKGQLYVLRGKSGSIAATAVIRDYDSEWENDEALPSLYIHNFVTDIKESGAGRIFLHHCEELAILKSKTALRLDCAADNEKLNAYYESCGFKKCGTCSDGPWYTGNKLQKTL